MTQRVVGRAIGVNHNHVSNLERGERRPTPTLLAALDALLTGDERLGRLWESLNEANQPAWLSAIRDVQRDALSILQFQAQEVPGLLQTERYSRALISAISFWESPAWVNDRVEERMERAHWFAMANRPFLVTVLPESVIENPIGSPEIMREQLDHLVTLASAGRISLQIVTGHEHPGLIGPFMIIAPSVGPEVVYTESAAEGRVIDDSAEVARFKLRFGRLQAVALSPEQTLTLIKEKAEGFDG